MGRTLKVVSFDSDERTAQVQFFKGEIEEFELDKGINWGDYHCTAGELVEPLR